MAHRRTLSPSSPSSIGHTTLFPASAPRIVSKLFLEGKANAHKKDGANVKLYLKLTVPLDSVTPGMPIPLFSDESLKIVNSIVHPLDPQGVPYAFSSSILLQASRNLGLPNRSSKSYISLFPDHHPDQQLDYNLTGHISVVDYHVSYVLPKEFPSHVLLGEKPAPTPSRIGSLDKNSLYFMAAIDIVLPFQSAPPRAPYVLSIPIPRCLSNSIKFSIVPPSPARWDLSTTPTITPRPPGSPKSVSSSASSLAVENDELMICGSFPSAGTFEIRFALPDEKAEGQGRGRVGVNEISSISQWRILKRFANGVRVSLASDIKFKGIWYAGVATLVGLELALEDTGIGVEWTEGGAMAWEVNGSSGYTGFGSETRGRSAFLESRVATPFQITRTPSNSSLGSSLLRGPLPVPTDVPDFSFETGSPGSSRLGTPTSPSVSPLLERSQHEVDLSQRRDQPPRASPLTPLVIHLDMAQIGTSDKNSVDCAFYGELELEADEYGRIALPSFQAPAASIHRSELLIQSDIDGVQWVSERAREPIPLKNGVTQRCYGKATLVLTDPTFLQTSIIKPEGVESRLHDLTGSSVDPQPDFQGDSSDVFIPHVQVSITPLLPQHGTYNTAVRVFLPCAPSLGNFLEFGLASRSVTNIRPAVQLVAASVNHRVVEAEVLPSLEGPLPPEDSKRKSNDWVCWVKVALGQQTRSKNTTGEIEIVYMINSGEDIITPDRATINTLLPCFTSKVGWLELSVDQPHGWIAVVSHTNLMFHSAGLKISSYALDPYHFPILSVGLRRGDGSSKLYRLLDRCLFLCLGAILCAILLHLTPLFAQENRQENLIGQSSGPEAPLGLPSCEPYGWGLYELDKPVDGEMLDPSTPDQSTPNASDALLLRANALVSFASIQATRLRNAHWVRGGWEFVSARARSAWKLLYRAYHFPLPP